MGGVGAAPDSVTQPAGFIRLWGGVVTLRQKSENEPAVVCLFHMEAGGTSMCRRDAFRCFGHCRAGPCQRRDRVVGRAAGLVDNGRRHVALHEIRKPVIGRVFSGPEGWEAA